MVSMEIDCLHLDRADTQCLVIHTPVYATTHLAPERTKGRRTGVAALLLVSRPFHIEDRARGRVVATGEIDADGRVVWDETEASVTGELSDLAELIQQDVATGYSGGQLRPPLEWFEM
jgi:hypothetical protein